MMEALVFATSLRARYAGEVRVRERASGSPV